MDDRRLETLVAEIKRTGGDCARAGASPDQIAILLPFDHHAVSLDGRRGVLLTYHLMERAEQAEGWGEVLVVFAHAKQHPQASPEAQRVIDQLDFSAA